ncbi:MAG: SDR family NAD(P)-dependent oxidoreductase [Proteobacteria bacterium]|nr:SDR family NAD(P)-dependent oxidoreductase [Pseudomonadota bacterium]
MPVSEASVAIVTGGSSGIGRAVCEALAAASYRVVVADIDKISGTALADSIGGVFIYTDLSDANQCKALVSQTQEQFSRVDVLVNNGGFQHVSPLEDFPEDNWNIDTGWTAQ